MKIFYVIAIVLTALPNVTAQDDAIAGASTTGNLQQLAGTWKATESSHRILDSQLVSSNKTGFTISIDKVLGEAHRRSSLPKHYLDDLSAYLKKHGYTPVASGTIRFDHGSEGEHLITTKGGSLYLWFGIFSGGNPRIFLGRGPDESSVKTLVVEWRDLSTDSPVTFTEQERFATIVYERAVQKAND